MVRADADWIALDLFSQAEHDAAAQAILLTPSAEHLEAVHASMRAVAAEPATPRHDRAIVASTRSADSDARSRRGCRDRESHRAGASRARGRGSGRVVADDSTCRRDLRRRVDQRSARRLRCRSQSRAADVRHRAIRVAARRVRLSEALVGDPLFAAGRGSTRTHRVDAGHRRGSHRARAFGAKRASGASITTADSATTAAEAAEVAEVADARRRSRALRAARRCATDSTSRRCRVRQRRSVSRRRAAPAPPDR